MHRFAHSHVADVGPAPAHVAPTGTVPGRMLNGGVSAATAARGHAPVGTLDDASVRTAATATADEAVSAFVVALARLRDSSGGR